MNGLLRQYFPKKSNLEIVTENQIQFAVNQLNNRPRKCLAYKTPLEVFLDQPVALET
jgi:IS30 family transposase